MVALAPRMVILIIVQWIMLIVPAIMMKQDGTTLLSIGFARDHIGRQILIGVAIALAMSLTLTLLPIRFGLKSMVGSTQYTHAWQFAYDFAYKILGVALVEEVIFRGYVFKLLKEIRNTMAFPVALSSVLFGLIHITNGSVVQVLMTALIGALLCVCRMKIKSCTLLSLIIAHGVYDALITLWVGVL